jgi:hypothetical protein
MFKIDIEKISFVVIWLAVILVVFFYFLYRYLFLSIGQLILTLAPSIIFMVGMILFYNRDHKRVKISREKGEYCQTRELNWGMALKHDFLTYFIPFLIIILPFLFKNQLGLIDIFQAIATYLALVYLKLLYWGEI